MNVTAKQFENIMQWFLLHFVPPTHHQQFLLITFLKCYKVNSSSSLFDEMYCIEAPSINMIPKFINYKS